MSLELLSVFMTLALLAEILGTIGGFGSSMFFVPIAGMFLDFHSVLGITALFHISSNISKIALFRKGFNKKLLLTIGIPAVIFVIIGAYLSKFLNKDLLENILACFLVALSIFLIIFKKFVLKPTTLNSISGGALSGITAGLVGTGGAIRGLTMAAFNLEKDVFIATSAMIDLAIDASRSVVYFFNGYILYDHLYLIPILLVISVIGTFIGKKLLDHFSHEVFKNVVLVLIFIVGAATLLKNFSVVE